MAKKRSEAQHQQIAKAAIRSTRKTTIRKPAKPSRKEHVKKSTISAAWLVMGAAICIVIVAAVVLVIDWLVYDHSCDRSQTSVVEDELLLPSAQCRRRSMFFVEDI